MRLSTAGSASRSTTGAVTATRSSCVTTMVWKPTTDTSPNGSCKAANGSRQDRSSVWAVRRAAAPARTWHFETRYYGQAFDLERLIDFESGILRRQTFLLKKSFFDIRSNAGQDFLMTRRKWKRPDKGGCGKSRRNLPHDQVGRYARRPHGGTARRYRSSVRSTVSNRPRSCGSDASSGSAKQTDEPEQGGVWYETGSVPDDATPETNYQIANKNSTKPSNT